jgi:hypothetical protein
MIQVAHEQASTCGHTRLSSKIVFENRLQKLSSKIVFENYLRTLSENRPKLFFENRLKVVLENVWSTLS